MRRTREEIERDRHDKEERRKRRLERRALREARKSDRAKRREAKRKAMEFVAHYKVERLDLQSGRATSEPDCARCGHTALVHGVHGICMAQDCACGKYRRSA